MTHHLSGGQCVGGSRLVDASYGAGGGIVARCRAGKMLSTDAAHGRKHDAIARKRGPDQATAAGRHRGQRNAARHLQGLSHAVTMSGAAVGHAEGLAFFGIGHASTGMPRRSLISMAFSRDGERSPVKS
jgi:hypothetical protein